MVFKQEEPKQLEWGRLVETLRVLRGWNKIQLAEAAGVNKATVYKYEKSACGPIGELRRKIEFALGIEGRSEEVATYLAELRETLLHPERRPMVEAARAGIQASRRMQAALWAGLEELRGGTAGEAEPGLPPRVVSATLRALLGWDRTELCRRARVHPVSVSRLESSRAGVKDPVREKIERALGLEGIREAVYLELCGLRAMMLAPRVKRVRELVAEAGGESARMIEQCYGFGLEELQTMEEARGERPGEPSPPGACPRGPWD